MPIRAIRAPQQWSDRCVAPFSLVLRLLRQAFGRRGARQARDSLAGVCVWALTNELDRTP